MPRNHYQACRDPNCESQCVQRRSANGRKAVEARWARVDQNPEMNGARGQSGLREKFRKVVRLEAKQAGTLPRSGQLDDRLEKVVQRRMKSHMRNHVNRGEECNCFLILSGRVSA